MTHQLMITHICYNVHHNSINNSNSNNNSHNSNSTLANSNPRSPLQVVVPLHVPNLLL
jgi:hypothetical protein